MATASQTVDIPLTLHVSRQTEEQLARRAAESGKEVADIASDLIEQSISKV